MTRKGSEFMRRARSAHAGLFAVVVLAGCMSVLLGAPRNAAAQVLNSDQALQFDRPEAWALKYFTSATLLGGLETPRTRAPWSISFGAELGWIPSVSEANRFIGFNGTKPEDLNKAPLFFRPRITIGLPGRFSAIVAVDPPIRAFGLTPRLLALAIERPVYETAPWTVGARGYGQFGTVKGAYTCPSSVLAFAPGSPDNLYGCQAESHDTATLDYIGGEVSVAHTGLAGGKLSPHAAIGVNYLAVQFQVDALTFGFEDHTHLTAHGVTVSGDAGVSYPLTPRITASFDAFYTPLTVRRSTGQQINAFVNVRALFTYRLR